MKCPLCEKEKEDKEFEVYPIGVSMKYYYEGSIAVSRHPIEENICSSCQKVAANINQLVNRANREIIKESEWSEIHHLYKRPRKET
jgi:hypothetical protein